MAAAKETRLRSQYHLLCFHNIKLSSWWTLSTPVMSYYANNSFGGKHINCFNYKLYYMYKWNLVIPVTFAKYFMNFHFYITGLEFSDAEIHCALWLTDFVCWIVTVKIPHVLISWNDTCEYYCRVWGGRLLVLSLLFATRCVSHWYIILHLNLEFVRVLKDLSLLHKRK